MLTPGLWSRGLTSDEISTLRWRIIRARQLDQKFRGNLIIGDEPAVNTKYFKYSMPLTRYAHCMLKNETIRITGIIRIGTLGSLLVKKNRKFVIEIKRQSGIKTLYVIGKQREAQNQGFVRKLRAARRGKKSTINQQFAGARLSFIILQWISRMQIKR